MNKLKIEYRNIDELKPYKGNPRVNEKAIPYVANSIKEFGFKVPIVIDKDNIIVAGHTRYQASILLGIKEMPCIIADDLTEKQIKAFRLVDNKVAEFSVWDLKSLKDELEEFKDIDISIFGLNGDIDNIIDILYDEGLGKPKDGINEKFSISFTSSITNIEKMKTFVDNHSKKELEDIFINVIKEIDNGNN